MQRSDLTLADVFTCDATARKLGLKKENPFSGKREQKAAAEAPEGDDETQLRTISHRHVSTMRRDWQAIRREVVMSAETFPSERLDVEQESAMSCMKSIFTSETNAAFIENRKVLLSRLFPEDIGTSAVQRSQIQDVLENALPAGSDTGATLSNRLRKLFSATQSAKTVQKTLTAMATLSSHSMQVERMVSHHNTIVQDR